MDMVGDLDIDVFAYRVGENAEGGWELLAFSEDGTQRWKVTAERLLDATTELATLVGIDLEG